MRHLPGYASNPSLNIVNSHQHEYLTGVGNIINVGSHDAIGLECGGPKDYADDLSNSSSE